MIYSTAKLWVALTFIASITASPFSTPVYTPLNKRLNTDPVIIGYRSVRPDLAKLYHDSGDVLVKDPQSRSSDQIGAGVYLSPKRGDWVASPSYWDCAVFAATTPWDQTNKLWVPEADTRPEFCAPLWWDIGAPNLPGFLTFMGPTFTLQNTARLSQADGFEKLQMVIPPELYAKSSGLNIKVECAAKSDAAGIAKLDANGIVNWAAWPNVRGTVQTVNPTDD